MTATSERRVLELQRAYVEACSAFAQAERARLEAELNARKEQLQRLSDELRRASRALHQARARLRAAEALLATERSRLEHDFEELLALPGVREVEVHGTRITVLTEPIVLEHQGVRYRIGDFALELDLERGITVRNLHNTGSRSHWDHPHVQGGLPCLGNLRDGLEKLLGACQLVPLVSMLLQFLETYTPDTAYCSIDLWQREADR